MIRRRKDLKPYEVLGCMVRINHDSNYMREMIVEHLVQHHLTAISKLNQDASVDDVNSVTGPLVSDFGNEAVIFVSSGNFFILFSNPDGTSIFVISAMR